MNDSKQRKLKRYWIDGGLCEMEPRGVFAECVHRIYLQDEADAVIFALEAENERLREALAGFINWSNGHGHHELDTLRREGLAILNEGEKP